MRRLAQLLVRFYQKTLSFDHGPLRHFYPSGFCKFYPTCSEYAYQAIGRHGVWKGMLLAAKRVWRCNPWSQAGLDPVPDTMKKAP